MQKGSIILVVMLAIAVVTASFLILKAKHKTAPKSPEYSKLSQNANFSANEQPNTSDDKPPLLIKNIGVGLDTYNPETNKAGDIVFTKEKLQFDRLFMDYGFVIPASPDKSQKANPQPTFILPLGTKVHSLVDGIVVSVPKLYSNDYSIHVASDTKSRYRYETEHVINPLVKEGDKVVAGQIIAEVSGYDTQNGVYGLVEIGILKGGNPPQHLCPFLYLDPSIKESINAKILAFYTAWNEYRGEQIYNNSNYSVPGCLTTSEIEG